MLNISNFGQIIQLDQYPFIPFQSEIVDEKQMLERADGFYHKLNKRRSVRHFSNRPVDFRVIEKLLLAASTAPSGAHKQPWTFCAVSNLEIKNQIRKAAEQEEFENYHSRMPAEWLADLAPLGTDYEKPFLEIAPWIIVVFKQSYGEENGLKKKHYYVNESVGLACGFLLAAIHQAGLVALTHTPSPMNFLTKILNRPENEKPFLLIPIGYPAEDALVPDIHRKKLDEIVVWFK